MATDSRHQAESKGEEQMMILMARRRARQWLVTVIRPKDVKKET
jgi:hypothetical protein